MRSKYYDPELVPQGAINSAHYTSDQLAVGSWQKSSQLTTNYKRFFPEICNSFVVFIANCRQLTLFSCCILPTEN